MTSSVATSLTSLPASERAYEHVKGGILDGTYPGSAFLTEGQVAAAIGISRTPVREALLRLQTEGMVELYPKKGAMVVPVTATEAREVFEARMLIEEWAAQQMWSRRTDAVPLLQALVAEMAAHRRTGDATAFSAADRAFHEVIVEVAGNSVITRQYRHLRDRQVCIVAANIRAESSRMTTALHGHQELLKLLQEGTKADFVRATRAHVTDIGSRVGAR